MRNIVSLGERVKNSIGSLGESEGLKPQGNPGRTRVDRVEPEKTREDREG